MTIAFWCVLIAAMLPYIWVGLAKYPLRNYDNHAPRDFEEKLRGWKQRANWAQLNGYEAFPPFAAGVLIAQQLAAQQAVIDTLAVSFVIARILHGVLYIADRAGPRSLVWTAGFFCVIGLFIAAA
jgi:uncharacterized MAPEG superfamily protein